MAVIRHHAAAIRNWSGGLGQAGYATVEPVRLNRRPEHLILVWP